MPHRAFVRPLTVGKKSVGLIFFDKLLEHGVKMLKRIFFRVFEVIRVPPLVYGVINAEAHSRTLHCVFKLHKEIPLGCALNGVKTRCVFGFIEAVAVVVLGNEVYVLCACFFEKLCRSGCEIYQKKIGVSLPLGTRVRICDEAGEFFALGEVKEYENGTAVKAIKTFTLG